MKNKLFYGKIAIAAVIVFFCGCTLFAAVKSTTYAQGHLELVGRLATKALENGHLRKMAQDHKLSAKIFDEYFRELDPGKVYFTQEDIAVFHPDRWRLLDEINSGELRVIFAIYARYIERLKQYRAFAEKAMKDGISFDGNETYRADRKDLAYCANDTELKQLWMKRLKNDLLW